MIFLNVMLSNRLKASINIDKITAVIEHENGERITVNFGPDESVEITTSLSEFGNHKRAALYNHKIANK
jgi:hypothetical protein